MHHENKGSLESDIAELLPANYQFEIPRTVARIKQIQAKRVALQFPEGLLQFSVPIANILAIHARVETVILGDVTYGACCVDDLGAMALGCDFLVHYGHSCLISIKDCVLPKMMYVFVEIGIDLAHFISTVQTLIPSETNVTLFSTIQFVMSLRSAAAALRSHFPTLHLPQEKPLSCGEVLGCTSPILPQDTETVIYLGDGRFHLESVMIHNPTKKYYQYDPYTKILSSEHYDYEKMKATRWSMVQKAKQATTFALVLGTLGRQGSTRILNRLEELMRLRGRKWYVFLMSELSPQKIAALDASIDVVVQIACPRLSIDWGLQYSLPLLTPYEAEVALGVQEWREQYPMDHYALSGGKWAVYSDKTITEEERRKLQSQNA